MTDQPFEFIAVLDFEATCGNDLDPDWDSTRQEIIELPVGLVSVASREVIDTFGTFVRPVVQPKLTDFCTELTSIRQADVDVAPTIEEAFGDLRDWFDEHGLTADNCLVATCGDWDLRRMWPRQVSLVPRLSTPRWLQRWCNLKVVYAENTSKKRTGMMGMLQTLGLEHVGHHHRGADDVRNLCNLVIELFDRGGRVEPTWTDDRRIAEREHYDERLAASSDAVEEARDELARLPAEVDEVVRERLRDRIDRLEAEVARMRAYVGVFSVTPHDA